jgi:uncharacterized protein YaiI (UPF0178 family)
VPLILDGNNLLHRLSGPQRTRAEVRKQVLDATRNERMSVSVVFDGPPPAGMSARESLGNVVVVYSGSRSADDVIVGMIPSGPAAGQWSVITDDRGLADRVKERGATVRRLAEWRGRRRQKAPAGARADSKLSSNEIAEWESYFADPPDDEV